MPILISGYILFVSFVILPLISFIGFSFIIVSDIWSRYCFIWSGLSIIVGILQFLSIFLRRYIARRYTSILIPSITTKDQLYDLLNFPDNVATELKDSDLEIGPDSVQVIPETNLHHLNELRKSQSLLSTSDIPLIATNDTSLIDDTSLINDDTNITNSIDDKIIDNSSKSSKKHFFWTQKYSLSAILSGQFIIDLWIEYCKSDLRHFQSDHWVYHYHLIQGSLTTFIGLLIFITIPFLHVYSIFAWVLLFFSCFAMAGTGFYFLSLIWSEQYLSGKYCLYWIPIFIILIADLIIFQYAIYVLAALNS
jgi:hypothetical protein